MIKYQLIALGIVIILYFFSASWISRWTLFKLNITAGVLHHIEALSD